MNRQYTSIPVLQRMSSAWRRRRGAECDPLVGLMLAGQQSRPCPGGTIRWLRAIDFNG